MRKMLRKALIMVCLVLLMLSSGCSLAQVNRDENRILGLEANMQSEKKGQTSQDVKTSGGDETINGESEDKQAETMEESDSSKSEMKDNEQQDTMEKAADAAINMKLGWNLGNSFDATGDWIVKYTSGTNKDFETAWGNPVTLDTLMHKIKELGFQSVRIPVTWRYHFDEDGNIDKEWMSRVREVVDQAMEEELYCIINIHHDTGSDGWLRASTTNFEKNKKIYARLWEQIATEFQDYPEILLFEGFNEMLSEANEWNNPTADNVKAINSYNQLFVETVRATGGNNAFRNLVCCMYAAANSDKSLAGFAVPSDTAKDHLIAEVHFYVPYEFITEEGITWTTPISVYDSYVEQSVDQCFDRIEKYYEKWKVPVIVGEFACDDKQNTEDRIKWYTQVIKRVKAINGASFIWDNGNGFCMGLLDRVGDDDAFPEIIKACMEAAGN